MKNLTKTLGITGAALCAICCALPLIGLSIGIASLTAVAFYLEKIGILLIGASIIMFLYYRYKHKTASKSCEVGCDCNPVKPNV